VNLGDDPGIDGESTSNQVAYCVSAPHAPVKSGRLRRGRRPEHPRHPLPRAATLVRCHSQSPDRALRVRSSSHRLPWRTDDANAAWLASQAPWETFQEWIRTGEHATTDREEYAVFGRSVQGGSCRHTRKTCTGPPSDTPAYQGEHETQP